MGTEHYRRGAVFGTATARGPRCSARLAAGCRPRKTLSDIGETPQASPAGEPADESGRSE